MSDTIQRDTRLSRMSAPADVVEEQPANLKKFQMVCTGIMGAFLAFLIGFIIYISCTWNKVRINEYT